MSTPPTKMHDFCEITSSKRIFASEYMSNGVPFYRSKEIIEKQSGKLNVSTEIFISESRFEEISGRFGAPLEGDILLTSVGTLGVPYVVQKDERFYFKDGNLTWFRNFSGLDSDYLYYWLLSPIGKAELKKATIGSSQSAYTINLLGGLSISPHEIGEQRKIAHLLRTYDDLIAANQRRINLLEESARLLYRDWFVKLRFPGHETVPVTDGVPEEWELKPASEMIDANPRTLFPKDVIRPFMGMEALSEDSMVINASDTRPITGGAKFRNGDTLLARITPCLENGKTGFVQFLEDDDAVASGSTEFIVLRSRTVNPYWIYCLARSDSFREHAINSMAGSDGRQRVNTKCFDQYITLQPPSDLLQEFADKVRDIFEQVQSITEYTRTLKQARDMLLPKLMSGALDVSRIAVPKEVEA
jgi:type I restriction enzyme S subunit